MPTAPSHNNSPSGCRKRTIKPLAMNAADAADMLGVSAATMCNWRRSGIGPRYIRSGRTRSRILYRVTDLEAWLDAHAVDAE